ncbi:cobalamin biosynthesis protein [Ferrimonas balearica]|uniref:cobalamin biosynthesis protein CobD/CbiB n=1 Tax=Ferrimonas balearica TaxID=44012 RepID=UPI001C982A4C|nr:cobalamin biosynthesis protein [Ferrimonas balearica]MBY6107533.1 cobalamin biosynthesis protein [Ferrimonas balearica]
METLGPYHSLLAPPFILALAYLLSMLIPEAWRPRYLLAPLADSLARKTNKPGRLPQQQRLAGTLALLVVLMPVLLLVWVVTRLAAYPLPFELALLAWLLPGPALARDTDSLFSRLLSGQKTQARGALAHWTVRDTDSLSPLGLVKAGIEVQLEQARSQRFAVMFWYALAGPLAASLAWLCNELSRHWHPGRPEQINFGHWPSRLAALLMVPVNVLLGLTLSLYGNPLAPWRARYQLTGPGLLRSQQWPQLCLACSLDRQLGGPWQLGGQRHLRPRLGPTTLPEPEDLLRTRRLLSFATWLWLALLFLLGASLALTWHHLH